MNLRELQHHKVIRPNSNFYERFLLGKRQQKAANNRQVVNVTKCVTNE